MITCSVLNRVRVVLAAQTLPRGFSSRAQQDSLSEESISAEPTPTSSKQSQQPSRGSFTSTSSSASSNQDSVHAIHKSSSFEQSQSRRHDRAGSSDANKDRLDSPNSADSQPIDPNLANARLERSFSDTTRTRRLGVVRFAAPKLQFPRDTSDDLELEDLNAESREPVPQRSNSADSEQSKHSGRDKERERDSKLPAEEKRHSPGVLKLLQNCPCQQNNHVVRFSGAQREGPHRSDNASPDSNSREPDSGRSMSSNSPRTQLQRIANNRSPDIVDNLNSAEFRGSSLPAHLFLPDWNDTEIPEISRQLANTLFAVEQSNDLFSPSSQLNPLSYPTSIQSTAQSSLANSRIMSPIGGNLSVTSSFARTFSSERSERNELSRDGRSSPSSGNLDTSTDSLSDARTGSNLANSTANLARGDNESPDPTLLLASSLSEASLSSQFEQAQQPSGTLANLTISVAATESVATQNDTNVHARTAPISMSVKSPTHPPSHANYANSANAAGSGRNFVDLSRGSLQTSSPVLSSSNFATSGTVSGQCNIHFHQIIKFLDFAL